MTRFPGQSIQNDIREEGSCPGQWVHVVDHPGRTKQAPGEGVTCLPYSEQRQNPVRSEALSCSFPLSSLSFLLPKVLCLSASGRRRWQGQRWLCCCGVRGGLVVQMVTEEAGGQGVRIQQWTTACTQHTLWCKDRWRTAIGCPQQRMPSPVPLGRLLRPGRLWEIHGQHWYP